MDAQITTLDLFTGIAGFSLALKPICKTIAYADINPISQSIIKKHIDENNLDDAPLFFDVKDIGKSKNSKNIRADIVTAGFPCQDISVSNLYGKGIMGKRSILVFEALRIADLVRASIIVLENSPNIVNRGIDILGQVLNDYGYDYVYDFFSAEQVGAPHIRKRFYLLAFKRKSKRAKYVLETLTGLKETKHNFWKNGFKADSKQKVVPKTSTSYKDLQKRTFLLGNAIVPSCAKHAIWFLSTYLVSSSTSHLPSAYENKNIHTKKMGFLDLSKYNSKGNSKTNLHPFTMIIPKEKYIENEDFKLGEPLIKYRLSTPLSRAFYHSRVGGFRSSRILQNEIIYDTTTLMNKEDKNVDHWVINPKYIEWLMGYPPNWTRLDSR